MIWAHWNKQYSLLKHNCQQFVKLLYKAICEVPIRSVFESCIMWLGQFDGRGNITDLWKKKVPFQWRKLFTQYPGWVCCVVGGCILIGLVTASHGWIVVPLSVHILNHWHISLYSLALSLIRFPRWVSERQLRKKLEMMVKLLLNCTGDVGRS